MKHCKRDIAAKRARELKKFNPLFAEFASKLPRSEDAEIIEAWEWVQQLTGRVIQRTIKDMGQSLFISGGDSEEG